jgi:hypothetical protein
VHDTYKQLCQVPAWHLVPSNYLEARGGGGSCSNV